MSTWVPALAGAVVGALVGFGGSWLIQRNDRKWQDQRDKFERQLRVVQPLDEILVRAERRVIATPPASESRWVLAHEVWEEGLVSLTPLLADQELDDRYTAVGTILHELQMQDGFGQLKAGDGRFVAMRAIANARQALAYWLRGDPLPSACFPTSERVVALLGEGDPDPLRSGSPLRRWLDQNPEAPWRPKAT